MVKKARLVMVIGMTFVVLSTVNLLSDLIHANALGGDAWDGKIEAGHYYVASHGHLTEVSKAAWTDSYMHVISIFITGPMGAVGVIMIAVVYVGEHMAKFSKGAKR